MMDKQKQIGRRKAKLAARQSKRFAMNEGFHNSQSQGKLPMATTIANYRISNGVNVRYAKTIEGALREARLMINGSILVRDANITRLASGVVQIDGIRWAGGETIPLDHLLACLPHCGS